MPSIYLIIGDYDYRLKAENLFEQEGNCFNSLIRFIDEENDLWILGTPFLKKYKIILDYNNTRIGLEHGEDVINYKDEYSKWIKNNNNNIKKQNSRIFFNYDWKFIIMYTGYFVGSCIIFNVIFWLYRDWNKSRKMVPDKYYPQTEENYNKEEKYQ